LHAETQTGELRPLLIAECDNVFLHGGLVSGHESDSVVGDGGIESETDRRINDGGD
jgi:hypothetical protein